MFLCPLVGAFSRLGSLSHKIGVVFLTGGKKTCRICHHASKVERGGDTLCHHIAGLVAVGRHDKALEIGCSQFMIDTPIVGILHGEQPFQVEHHLVQEVGRMVSAFGDVGVEFVKVATLLFVGSKHEPDAEGRIDHILVVVACIIPAIG